jgi:serine protease Do
MTMGKSFALTLLCIVCLQPIQGQTKSASVPTAEPGLLKDYDQAIHDVAERAMQSVVEIDVTGYGVPEKDKGQGDQQQPLERQRSLGSGVIVTS